MREISGEFLIFQQDDNTYHDKVGHLYSFRAAYRTALHTELARQLALWNETPAFIADYKPM